MSIAIKCPKCNRTLGDTDGTIRARINCKNCGAQSISIKVASFDNYPSAPARRKEENDKSE